jgi:hypothetical protein
MESRNPGHKRADTQGGLVLIASSQSYTRKMLPYEKQLAGMLGISEQEYIWFSEELKALQKPRPAEYAHIPDIRNEPVSVTTALVSLAIGIVSTAASVLLAPKPQQNIGEVQQLKQIKLGDLTGPSRFNATYGFESVAPLAQWGDVIPIAFGKYTQYSGGLLINPNLVWSRLFSYGNHQVAKLLYTCGEYGIATPNLRGIFMGNAPLDGSFQHNFTVYYRPEKANINGYSRIKANDLLYGTRATPYSGDPETFDDIYSCPTLEGEEDQGFCYAYTPGQNTAFGFYSPIVNGSVLRTNWKVVSFPRLEGRPDDPSGRIKREREKICGFSSREDGMPGQGRGYGRHIGIIEYNNGSGWSTVSQRTDVFIGIGSEIKVYISGSVIDVNFDKKRTGVDTSDLSNTSEQERIQADDQLQLGETFQIGRTIWVVTHRSLDQWALGREQFITLRCVDQVGSPQITILPKSMIDAQTLNLGINFTETNHIGLSSTPIGYQAMGIARAVRPCDVLEVGIKSRVFLQANGICNVNDIPSPAQLRNFDEEGTVITNGTINTYMRRSSCFTVKLRPVSRDGASVQEWEPLSDQFVIRGSSPVDMYNYIRFYFPTKQQQFEFRFEPLPGAHVIKLFDGNEIFYELDARNGTPQVVSKSTLYGRFLLKFTGRPVTRDDLTTNKELGIDRIPSQVTVTGTAPTHVSVSVYNTSPADVAHGKAHGWRNEVLGFAQLYQGLTRSAQIVCGSGGRSITLKITCTSIAGSVLASAPGYSPAKYTNWRWDAPRVEVVASAGSWRVGELVTYEVPITYDAATGNNKWLIEAYNRYGARYVKATFVIDKTGDLVTGGGSYVFKRFFSPSSQVADVTYYPGLLRASNADSPEHEIVYVNELTDNITMPTYYNMTMFGLSIRSGRNITGIEQLRFWVPGGINVKRFYPQAPHFEDQSNIGRSNLFSDLLYFLLTDKDAGAGDKVSTEMIDEESFAITAKFLSTNKIFCDIVLQEPVNIRNWATSVAPLMLCNFTISNGKFGVYPALPVNVNGRISLGAVPIAAIFTEGNIIEDTFECTYFRAEERADFKAVVIYRTAKQFELPERLSAIVRYAGPDTGKYPIEEFDMADWCTQESQAVLACKYMLALRRHVTHAVSFKTSPEGLSLKPGDYIRVLTQSNPFIPTNIGTVDSNGRVRSVEPFDNGTYNITYYVQGDSQDVQTGSITIQNNVVTNSSYYGIVFSTSDPIAQSGVYFVERLTLDEDCMVEVVASSFPCDENLVSVIAKDVFAEDNSSTWWISK